MGRKTNVITTYFLSEKGVNHLQHK